MDSNYLTAEQAREIVEETKTGNLIGILDNIKKAANRGQTMLHVYEPVKSKTISKLKELGYQIPPSSTISAQKDNLYCTIHW